MIRSTRRIVPTFVLAVVIAGLTAIAAETSKDAKRYKKLANKANDHIVAGRYDKALKLVEAKMAPLAPEGTLHLLFLAAIHTRSGNNDAAFAALEDMIERGGSRVDDLLTQEDLQPLREDPRFDSLLARMETERERWIEEYRTLHHDVDPAGAESFDNLDALIGAFDERVSKLEASERLIGWREYARRRAAILDRKVASLERLIADSDDEAAERAALEAVRTAFEYKKSMDYYGGDAALIVEKAERFLDRWPASEAVAEVRLKLAVATWKAYGAVDRDETLALRAEAAEEILERLVAEHPESAEAGKAPIWSLRIAFEAAGGETTPRVGELYETVRATVEDDETLAAYAWWHAARPMYQLTGEQAFDGTDLDGNRWTWEKMRGKVVLIDFWSTSCQPCIAELPHMKEAYERYHDQGFEIVGVSLDTNRSTFVVRCRDRGIVWPQILEGDGWESGLVRMFRVRSIPTPILIDREGRVVATRNDVRGEKLLDLVAQLINE
jgi:thiol-disulfide isomerase/thioredoxin/outer membrane protein assembly factor BamD (BamD/ComL family)